MYTTPLYCTGALYTFSYTVSTNQRAGAAEPSTTWKFQVPQGSGVHHALNPAGLHNPALVIGRHCITECAQCAGTIQRRCVHGRYRYTMVLWFTLVVANRSQLRSPTARILTEVGRCKLEPGLKAPPQVSKFDC